ncbi:hypothetical protein N9934_00115 [Desulfosarcina sp.]|nr:hypothetical protein [Desulfosarcina sp.]
MKFLFYSIIFVFILLLTSCYPEYKIARSYIDSKPDISIMVLPTNYVFKKNLKVEETEDIKDLDEIQKDSAMMANSAFLKNISDSIVLETFINSMIIEFEQLGFKVYTETQLDSFLFIKTPAYIFNIAQIELEEHYNVHEDKQDFGEYTYYKAVDLDAVSYNFWFELSELNDGNEDTKLLYSSETINDVVYGYFAENMFTGGVKYKYNINEIDLDVIYRYCGVFGERNAGYAFDYLMNKYMVENWPPDKTHRFYMQYKRMHNTLDPTINDKFVELE